MGISASQLTPITASQFTLITQGPDYFPTGMFLRNASTGEISEYAAGQFHLVSVPVATTMGLTGSNTVTITAAQYNNVPKGSDYFPENMLIQNVQTGEIDVYSGGLRHWISVPVATKMNITTAQLTTISASQFNAISQGSDYFPEGSYLENQVTGEISQYSGGYDHLISTPVATVMGLSQSQLISVTPAQYNAIPKGLDYYPNGIFIENNATGEVDQMSGGQRYWVPSQDLTALDIPSSTIATIGADQFNAIPVGGVFTMPATAPQSQPTQNKSR
jgi:hypothetical protein